LLVGGHREEKKVTGLGFERREMKKMINAFGTEKEDLVKNR